MLQIKSVRPTVLFVAQNGKLLQAVDITVENDGNPVGVAASLKTASGELSAGTGRASTSIANGISTCRVFVPDIREPQMVELLLNSGNTVHGAHRFNWKPRKHWRIHLIPIAHHDLGYTDTIEAELAHYCRMYMDILRFCTETDGLPDDSKFRYTTEGAWSLQYFVENSPPEVIAELAGRVQEGRIEIPALIGNEISGLCSHEELVRLMYPSFRLQRLLGGSIRTGSITDVPGLSWGLPSVLANAGVKYFFAGLPDYFTWDNVPKALLPIHEFWDRDAVMRKHGPPDAFYWQGPDGGKVLTYYQISYGCWSPHSCNAVLDALPGMLDAMDSQDNPFSVMRYGGFGCGDNTDPEVIVSYVTREWNDEWAFPKLVVSTNSMFFAELEKECLDLRTCSGELPHTDYAVGAISTAVETIKNRVTHDVIHAAEKFAALSSAVAGAPDMSEKLRIAYDNMMLYDEHTWGKAYPLGESQDLAWNEKSQYAHRASALAESVRSHALAAIVHEMNLEDDAQRIVVFNPLSFIRTDPVVLEKIRMSGKFALIDEDTGREVAHQVVKLKTPQAPVPYAAGRYARGQFEQHELYSLAFVAQDVPSLGYRTYRIVKKQSAPAVAEVVVGNTTLENQHFKVSLDPKTGAVTSIFDKALAKELVDSHAAHQLNQLVVRHVTTARLATTKRARIKKGEKGPVYGSLVVTTSAPGCPQLTQEVILYDGIKRIDFANRLLKDSTPAMEVYFAFPFDIDNPDFRFEGSNSVIKPFHDQFPGSNTNYYSVQHWANASDGSMSVILAPVEAHLVEFGGLWPCYVSQAHHGATSSEFGRPFVTEDDFSKGHMYSFVTDTNFRTNFKSVQYGDLLFRYSISSAMGNWPESQPRDFGWAVSNPLIPVHVTASKTGLLPKSAEFCSVDQHNVVVSTIKKAEDDDGMIVRLLETEGKTTKVSLALPCVDIGSACLTDVVENGGKDLSVAGRTVKVPVEPYGIATVRIRPA
jgi:alpha-mannosidase